jgi:hypothetical protein
MRFRNPSHRELEIILGIFSYSIKPAILKLILMIYNKNIKKKYINYYYHYGNI